MSSLPSTSSPGVGLKVIIWFKFCKATLMLGVALWLTISPGSAFRDLEMLSRELTEGGAAFGRLGHWLHEHLSSTVLVRGAALAWLDCISTTIEGILLLTGKPWAQWVVVAGLAVLLPFEILSIEHRPGVGKFLVLAANAAIVIYLARNQIKAHQARRSH